jgi:hypothetical protein
MKRIVAVAVVACSLTLVVARYFQSRETPAVTPEQVRHEQLLERIDKLERLVAATAAMRPASFEVRAIAPAEGLPTEPAADPQSSENRDSALRDGNAVVERALQAARWSQQDAIELHVTTAALSGQERAEIYARLSAAINSDRLQVDAAAFGF